MKTLFSQLETKIREQGYSTYLVPLDEKKESHQIIVSLNDGNELTLTILYLGDLLNLRVDEEELSTLSQEFQESNVDFLQLFVRFPIEIQEDSIPGLARLILMANWSTPIGAFGLNESQKFIYYRHVFESMGGEPGVDVVIEAINAMAYYARVRFESLALIASGGKTLEAFLNELEEQGLKSEEFPGYDL
ncbi:MAG TPA: hypothetical protein VK856_00415 [Anaerolineaceae bacterium]|nr:hypothetical protein [Anaerolineaceae bacterium]